MRTVAIIRCPGSGKTTLAQVLSDRLGVEHIELDELYHGPNWTPTPRGEFSARLRSRMEAASSSGWVTCGNYVDALDALHLTAADTIVWLDLPRPLVMARVVRRTLSRALWRTQLWNGNREPWSNFYRWNPEHNIVRWAWVEHPRYRRRYSDAVASGRWSDATLHHLRSRAEVARFVQALPSGRA